MQNFRFDSHGYKLSGNLFIAPNPHPLAFLFIQGWTGHQNKEAAQALADLGFTSMTYDMRGNGDSEGNLAEFSRSDFIADAVTAYDFLRQKLSPSVSIGAVGSSFGCYTAILLSEQRALECLSLRVPASYPDKGFADPQLPQIRSAELSAWRNKTLSYDNRAFSALHKFGGKVQIVEADRDEVVPHQAVQNYADSIANKKNLEYVIMRDAPHRLENEKLRSEYSELLINWARQFTAEK